MEVNYMEKDEVLQLSMEINNLKELIEKKEKVKLEDLNKSVNEKRGIFDFKPVNINSGDPDKDVEARPTIRVKVDKENRIFTLQLLYLKCHKKGTGSLIFDWIKEYCIEKEFKLFKVRGVKANNEGMNKLCHNKELKVDESVYEEGSKYYHYSMIIN